MAYKHSEKQRADAQRRTKKYREAHPERVAAQRKAQRLRLKLKVFEVYGGPLCACCNEKYIEFLSIDHINGGGNQHMKQVGLGNRFYQWLRKNNYPLGYRVLCMNCNFAIGRLGYCPHQSRTA